MSLKETWITQDNTMDADAEVVNQIAEAVIKNEDDIKSTNGKIPTKVSQIENDEDFVSRTYVDEAISEIDIDVDVPTKVSQLENDKNYVTSENLPTKVSQLENDSEFATQQYVDEITGDIDAVLDELHNYAQALISGGVSE